MFPPPPIGVAGEPVNHVWPKPFDEHPEEAIALADLDAARRAWRADHPGRGARLRARLRHAVRHH